MYYPIIHQCSQARKNLEVWLDKAEQYATTTKFDVGVLMKGRLAPDMRDFIYQVQSACDYVKGAAAGLSGQTPPRHEDNEQTIEEVLARIRKTVAFAAARIVATIDVPVTVDFEGGYSDVARLPYVRQRGSRNLRRHTACA
jgi:hypothetical protein